MRTGGGNVTNNLMPIPNTNIRFGNVTAAPVIPAGTVSVSPIVRSRTNTIKYSPPQSRKESFNTKKVAQPRQYAVPESNFVYITNPLVPYVPPEAKMRGPVRQYGLVRQEGSRKLFRRNKRKTRRHRRV